MHLLLTQTFNPKTNTLDFHLHFFIMIDEDTSKAMMIIDFTLKDSDSGDPWLDARSVLDTLRSSPSIETARDKTNQYRLHGYPPTKGVDID